MSDKATPALDDEDDNETFYDAEIAPALLDLSRKCAARGMSLVAVVDYDDKGSVGRTVSLVPGCPAMVRYVNALAQCWCEGGTVNIDGFMMAVMREAADKGHSSMILKQLGVPLNPALQEASHNG